MRVLVPFEASDPKTRLASRLDADERRDFAAAMLRDVLDAVADAGGRPEVVATAPTDVDAPATVDERPLSAAVNARLAATADPVGVVVADLGLVTPAAIDRLLSPSTDAADAVDAADTADVVVAPGRGGGTNGLVVRHPDFRVDFHGVSYRDHRAAASAVGADVRVVDSMRLSADVDEPADLAEVLLHGEGAAAAWLRDAGFELRTTGGRVVAARGDD